MPIWGIILTVAGILIFILAIFLPNRQSNSGLSIKDYVTNILHCLNLNIGMFIKFIVAVGLFILWTVLYKGMNDNVMSNTMVILAAILAVCWFLIPLRNTKASILIGIAAGIIMGLGLTSNI